MGTEPTCDCFGDGFQASTFGRAHDGVERCDFCGRPVKNPTVTVYANDLDDLQTALTTERDARERAEQERDVLRSGAEYVALRKLVKDAYNEGFTEGMREHTSSRGGKPWPDSAAKKALDRICFDCGDAKDCHMNCGPVKR